MKTFKWTVPTLPLTKKEQMPRPHPRNSNTGSCPDEYFEGIAQNYYERNILNAILKTKSFLPFIWPLPVAVIFTYTYPLQQENYSSSVLIWWFLAIICISDYFRQAALKRMLMRIKKKHAKK